jgi:hypothetical protein
VAQLESNTSLGCHNSKFILVSTTSVIYLNQSIPHSNGPGRTNPLIAPIGGNANKNLAPIFVLVN